MEVHNIMLVIVAAAFAVSAAPESNRRQDIHHLVSLINNMRHIKTARDELSPLTKLDSDHLGKVSDFPELAESELIDNFEDEETVPKRFIGKASGQLNKRQGAWSYDYGLGGGRFGKRNYGDYGIGGGRFGRDLDHVDLSDVNDPDLQS